MSLPISEFSPKQRKLISKIRALKKEKNAILLVHNYQRPEIFEVADFIGDSLGLCEQARKTKAELIVFCGVYFMAESAAILNPDKRVVIPDPDSGCALSNMITAEQLREFKAQYPGVPVVMYVNSFAEVKAESDICCTSSNAVAVVKSLKDRRVIFAPDQNLANYVAKQVPNKEIIPWNGYCPIHSRLTAEYVAEARKNHPKAKVVAHPECREEVISASDYCCSTSQMIKVCKEDPAPEFIILTECGMIHRLKKEIPEKQFYTVCSMCFDMKKNTLEKIIDALENETHPVTIAEPIRLRAFQAFHRMFDLKNESA